MELHTGTPGAIAWLRSTIGPHVHLGALQWARNVLAAPPATGDGSDRARARVLLDLAGERDD